MSFEKGSIKCLFFKKTLSRDLKMRSVLCADGYKICIFLIVVIFTVNSMLAFYELLLFC
jgi:hypothetical protein